MASTSTGFAKGGIYKEQYSSGGQLMGFSSLCTNRYDAGAVNKFSSGSIFLNENVKKSTASSTAVQRTGVTIVATSIVNKLAVPVKGRVMDVIFLPTTGKAAKIATGSTAIFFNSSGGKDFVISVILATSKASNHGLGVRLYGGSTKQWWVSIPAASTIRYTVAMGAAT